MFIRSFTTDCLKKYSLWLSVWSVQRQDDGAMTIHTPRSR